MALHAEELYITLPDRHNVTLHTIISRTGKPSVFPTLLLLHFAGGSNRTYAPLIAQLQGECNIVAPSLRGWGNSDRPSTGYRMDDYAEDVLALIAELRNRYPDIFHHGITVVGHSMGGKIAQLLITRQTIWGMLKGLVLIGPAPAGSTQLQTAEMREQQIQAYNNTESARLAVQHALLGHPGAVSDAEIAALATDIAGGGEEAKRAWPEYGIGEDHAERVLQAVRAYLALRKLRVLVMTGSLDRIESPERVRSEVVEPFEKAGAAVTLCDFQELGHLMVVEDAASISEPIRKFLIDC